MRTDYIHVNNYFNLHVHPSGKELADKSDMLFVKKHLSFNIFAAQIQFEKEI